MRKDRTFGASSFSQVGAGALNARTQVHRLQTVVIRLVSELHPPPRFALSKPESGVPVAVTIASKEPKSEVSKTEGEITTAKRFYQKVDLRNARVTGDALHCERENMQLVIENNGDFLLQLKENQPTALAEAQRIAASGSPPFCLQNKRSRTRSDRTPPNRGLPH